MLGLDNISSLFAQIVPIEEFFAHSGSLLQAVDQALRSSRNQTLKTNKNRMRKCSKFDEEVLVNPTWLLDVEVDGF
jgi:hypothetical protein